MRVLSLVILIGIFLGLPYYLLEYHVWPELMSLKDTYQNAGQIAEDIALGN